MRSLLLNSFAVIALLFGAKANAAEPDLTAIVKDIRGQIVQIVVPTPTPDHPDAVSKGSGFWLSEEGLVATCWHVVASNPTTSKILVLSPLDAMFDLQHGQVTNANFDGSHAAVVAKDEINDVVILQTENKPKISTGAIEKKDGHFLTAHFAISTLNSSLPEAGARVLLAGFPLGQPYLIVQPGTVAAIAHNLPGLTQQRYWSLPWPITATAEPP